MHISEMFVPRDAECFESRWATGCSDGEAAIEVLVVVIVGLLGLYISPKLFSSIYLGWMLPSIIMTFFVVWRIAKRSSVLAPRQRIGSFIWENIYLEELTGWKILLYLFKAYCPLLNWACIVAGVCSILSKEWYVRRA